MRSNIIGRITFLGVASYPKAYLLLLGEVITAILVPQRLLGLMAVFPAPAVGIAVRGVGLGRNGCTFVWGSELRVTTPHAILVEYR